MPLPDDWGARPDEIADAWPCDLLAPADALAWHRAVDVAAPRPVVYRWLCQLRIAPYSYDWIDNLGRRSPRTLTPGLGALEVGQTVMSLFRLVAFASDDHVTLETKGKPFGKLWVTYRVREDGAGTRLAVRLRIPRAEGRVGRVATRLLAWGDLLMMRKQLLTLAELAEADRAGGSQP